jgi:hypothetical protein
MAPSPAYSRERAGERVFSAAFYYMQRNTLRVFRTAKTRRGGGELNGTRGELNGTRSNATKLSSIPMPGTEGRTKRDAIDYC